MLSLDFLMINKVSEQVLQLQVTDIGSNSQGVLFQDLENGYIYRIYEQGNQKFHLLFITM